MIIFKIKKLLILSIISTAFSSEITLKHLSLFNNTQSNILIKSIIKARENGLNYELAAIALVESNLGHSSINIFDGRYGSYGPYQLNIYWYIKENKLTSKNQINKLVNDLITNIDISSEIAIKQLKYWINRYGSIDDGICGYNSGKQCSKSEKGREYMLKVKNKISILENLL